MNDGSWGDWFPYLAGAFKLIILGIGAFLAIKWHFDEDKRVKEEAGEMVDQSSSIKKVALILFLLLLVVILVVYATDKLLY
ncbi:hypothetical protein [Vibrio tritonius]|uniref:hypothetical protein n=1 Tax=Vibrio tritonius TaxID=1435069 RepID=UPI00315C6E49